VSILSASVVFAAGNQSRRSTMITPMIDAIPP
jgi:hypothetical protein